MSRRSPVSPPEAMACRRLARDVVIDRVRSTLTVDGREFPYWIAQQGPEVLHSPAEGVPVVFIPLLADNVRIVTADGDQTYPDPWPMPDGDEPAAAGEARRYDTGVNLPPLNTMVFNATGMPVPIPITPVGEDVPPCGGCG